MEQIKQRLSNHWMVAGILFLVAILVSSPTITFGFISLDDGLLIVNNPLIRSLHFPALKHMFTSFDPELYVPLTTVSFAINYVLAGTAPWIFHLTNVLLHGMNVTCVFLIGERLTGRRSVAVITALLFLLHPINTEAVAWASARKDLLASTFFLISLLCWLSYGKSSQRTWYAAALMSFVLALLSKVTAATLPAVIILIECAAGRSRSWKELAAATGPFFALSILFGSIGILGKSTNIAGLGTIETLLLSTKSFVFMLWKIIVPIRLSVLYPQTNPISFSSSEFFLPLLISLLVIGVTITTLRKYREIVSLILFVIITFLPSIFTFMKNGELYFFSDRYAYLPSIGIFFLVAVAADHLSKRYPRGGTSVVTAICLSLGILSQMQMAYWKDSATLFRHAVLLAPLSALANNNLGDALLTEGKTDEAMQSFEAAIKDDPAFMQAWINRGNILMKRRDVTGALEAYRAAIKNIDRSRPVRPDDLLGYYSLGEALSSEGKIDEGLTAFTDAATMAPALGEPQYNAATKLHEYGRSDEAIVYYRKAIDLDPGNLDARYGLAALLAEKGSLADAKRQLEAIVAIDPNYAEAEVHLGNILKILREK